LPAEVVGLARVICAMHTRITLSATRWCDAGDTRKTSGAVKQPLRRPLTRGTARVVCLSRKRITLSGIWMRPRSQPRPPRNASTTNCGTPKYWNAHRESFASSPHWADRITSTKTQRAAIPRIASDVMASRRARRVSERCLESEYINSTLNGVRRMAVP